MSFRIEEKLYIEKNNLVQFKEQLKTKSCQKIYQPRIIESLYFDNINLDMYTESIEGITPRKKIRVRRYPENNDKKFYFEIKNSSVEGRFKTRKVISDAEFQIKKSSGYLDNQYGICFPILYVKYFREYLVAGDVRISIDKEIQYLDYNRNFKLNDERIIVELKTHYQKDLDQLTNDFPYQRIRFSKYCFGIEKLQLQ